MRKLFFTECHCADDGSKTYEDLFAKLDANKDGIVDVSELKAGLAAMGISSGRGAAQVGSHWNRGPCAQSEEEERGRGAHIPSFHSSSKPPPGLSNSASCRTLWLSRQNTVDQ